MTIITIPAEIEIPLAEERADVEPAPSVSRSKRYVSDSLKSPHKTWKSGTASYRSWAPRSMNPASGTVSRRS